MIIGIIIGALISAAILGTILIPKVKRQEVLNAEIVQLNEKNKKDFFESNSELKAIQSKVNDLQNEQDRLLNSIDTQKTQAKKIVDDYYAVLKEQVDDKINQYKNDLNNMYEDAARSYEQEYEKTLNDCVNDFTVQICDRQKVLFELNGNIDQKKEELNDLRSKVESAVNVSKRAEEANEKKDFYRLVLSPDDLDEISKLRGVEKYLRDKEPLNKVIWKVYYEKPYTDLIGRVIGAGVHTGIYKITNLANNKCYIGQSVNIGR